MTVIISRRYGVSFPCGRTMAYYGEHKLRKMQVIHPIFPDAVYVMKFAYNDGVIYEVPVENGIMTVDGSLLRYEGEIDAQFYAYVKDDDGGSVNVFQSGIFQVIIGKCLDGNVTAIPTYESSADMLEQLIFKFKGLSATPGEAVAVLDSAKGTAGNAEEIKAPDFDIGG